MNIIEYQNFCLSTAVYPNISKNWKYPLIGLFGEIGELANILKKATRDNEDQITENKRRECIDELGDIFWYLMVLCYELKIDPIIVLGNNIGKLKTRMENNTIHDKGRNEID